ncbi:hypothetical protein [Aurantiacibacter sp. D1-12]|uniref:hypothetical protein n=1 Tax=Aurantiacibacter sp. D1-12 TaxID=2993658 RepID=UPI00237CD42C|nr:hypothetical protein [Aurantiacibacter sp. D1-12]MDE1467678.1 hypothetical protein [Aurantiacibacter sp. D1-12]
MRRTRWLGAAALALAVTSPAAAQQHSDTAHEAASDSAAGAFDRLKSLEGMWQLAGQPEHGLRINFSTTARGSVLVEEWTYQGQRHSLTLYHRDGNTLLATHYCPQGNQPRMALATGEEGTIRFTFRDVTDYDPASEQHQHDLWFAFDQADQITRGEIYRDGEAADRPSALSLERGVEWTEQASPSAEPPPAP